MGTDSLPHSLVSTAGVLMGNDQPNAAHHDFLPGSPREQRHLQKNRSTASKSKTGLSHPRCSSISHSISMRGVAVMGSVVSSEKKATAAYFPEPCPRLKTSGA